MDRLAEHLERGRPRLVARLARTAGWLLRHETAEDLAQGVHLRALEAADGYEDRGEAAFRAWLERVARQHLAARARHWRALKRSAGRMLRVVGADPASGVSAALVDPTADGTGPVTFAARREMVALGRRALLTLPERDRDLVRWRLEGEDTAAIAARLGLTEAAAQRAAHRAQERFARAVRFLAG